MYIYIYVLTFVHVMYLVHINRFAWHECPKKEVDWRG